jgi:hypothetical protein
LQVSSGLQTELSTKGYFRMCDIIRTEVDGVEEIAQDFGVEIYR